MAAINRIIANNVSFKLPTTDFATDLISIEFVTEDAPGGVRTFGSLQTDQQWKATLTGIFSPDDAGLHRTLITNYGTSMAFTVAPQGGAVGTDAAQYAGTMKIDALPPISLTAGETAQFSISLTVDNSVHNPASHIFWGLEVKTA